MYYIHRTLLDIPTQFLFALGATSQKQVHTSSDGWLPPYGGHGSGCDNGKGDGGVDGDESDGAECDGERCGDGSTRGTCDPTSASKARRDPKSTGGERGAYDDNGEAQGGNDRRDDGAQVAQLSKQP